MKLAPWTALIGIGLLALGCGNVAEGRFVVTGHPNGDFTMVVDSCASAEHEKLLGVLLVADDRSGGVRAIKDAARGDYVQVEVPGSCQPDGRGCRVVEVRPANCTTFDFPFETTTTRHNYIFEVQGSLDLACSVGDTKLEATATFSQCH